MTKTPVNIEPIIDALATLRAFNQLDLAAVELWLNGKPILGITPELLDRFRFVGLSNKCFVEMGWWKPEGPTGITELFMTSKAGA